MDYKRNLNAFLSFCINENLLTKLGKTKVMIFNTYQAWVGRLELEFFLGEGKVTYRRSWTYLGVIFIGPWFSLLLSFCSRRSDEYAALVTLERQFAYVLFQEPQTKLWLFDTCNVDDSME